MKIVSFFAVLILIVGVSAATAQVKPIASSEYLPPNGKGRVVVLFSGQSGPTAYVPFAKEIAKAGYYAVLVDGNDIWKPTAELTKGVIVHAQQSPNAIPGKVGVVAFSLGGGPALDYAARESDLVAAVVAFYPLTSYITDPTGFVATRIKVPTIVLAAVRDTYMDCCLIEMARKLAAAAKAGGQPLALTEYPDALHGFNLAGTSFRDKDASDGLARTLVHLQKYLPPTKG